MSGSSGRRNRRRQLGASHQKNWLTGLHAVEEMLTAGVWPAEDLYIDEAREQDELAELSNLAAKGDVDVHRISRDRLTELCHSRHHQGVAARMGAFPYRSLSDVPHILAAESADTLKACVAVCDRIMDAHNFGAILRCCDAMKVNAVIIGETEQAGVTPHVARASSGAVNHVPVVLVDSLIDACTSLHEQGLTLAAASEKSSDAVWDTFLNQPLSLVIGNEARGVSAELLQLCQLHLRIPMLGRGESLNAAVAAGTLLYEIRRQQYQS